MKRIFYIGSFVLLLVVMFTAPALAQCPMCKAAVESSLASGSHVASGLNKGILYLLLMPYLLYATIFTTWYFKRRKAAAAA